MFKKIFKAAKDLIRSPVGQLGIGLLVPQLGFLKGVSIKLQCEVREWLPKHKKAGKIKVVECDLQGVNDGLRNRWLYITK